MPPDSSGKDPHEIPLMEVDRESIVALVFERRLPEADEAGLEVRGDDDHERRLRTIADDCGLLRLAIFQLISLPADWHRAWIVEFPTFAGRRYGWRQKCLHHTTAIQRWPLIWLASGPRPISWVGSRVNRPPDGFTPDEWWFAVIMRGNGQFRTVLLTDSVGERALQIQYSRYGSGAAPQN